MPATSKSQQRLFSMALAVRKGDLPRSKVWKAVLDIVDSDMTNKEIEDFTVLKENKQNHMKTLKECINESMNNPTSMAKTIKTWVMECMPMVASDDDLSLEEAGRMTDAIITGLRQGIHEYEKKYPNDTKTLGFLNLVAKNLTDVYEKSF